MRRLIDNSTTPPARQPHIGHYGRLRKAYLEGYRPDLYTALVASEKLYVICGGLVFFEVFLEPLGATMNITSVINHIFTFLWKPL